MTRPRVAFITNLSPYYRRPLFERLADELDTTFFFFGGRERYLGQGMDHDPGNINVRELFRLSIAGQPLLPGLWSELRASTYDVVVKDLNGRLMVPYVHQLTRARGIPLVLWSGMWHHPRTISHSLTRPLVERVYRDAAAIVVYGDHVERHLAAVAGVNRGKIFVAGQAIDPTPLADVAPTFGEPAVILFVGQLEEHKGIRDLLLAFDAISAPSVALHIVGSGSLAPVVSERARQDNRVRLVGYVPNSQLPVEIAGARCLVLPAVTTNRYREAWGLVVNEAMTAGLPVVATEAVGAAAGGLVINGQNGLVVPERNPMRLAEALDALVVDAQLARSLGEQARRDVAAFDFDRMARAFTGAIDHALQVPPRVSNLRSARASAGRGSGADSEDVGVVHGPRSTRPGRRVEGAEEGRRCRGSD